MESRQSVSQNLHAFKVLDVFVLYYSSIVCSHTPSITKTIMIIDVVCFLFHRALTIIYQQNKSCLILLTSRQTSKTSLSKLESLER